MAKEAKLLFAVFVIFASVVIGGGYLGYAGYKKMTAPEVVTYKYTTDRYVVITADTVVVEDSYSGDPLYEEFFLVDIKTRKAIDVTSQEEMDPSMFGYMVNREDYDRLHNGGMTDDEVELCKAFIDLTLHPEHENACCKTYDKDGNVIEHHHTCQGELIPTPKDCI